MDNVSFEVQSLLLRIRDYKKTNQLAMGSFGSVFSQANLQSLLKYEDQDEQVSIALINFYSKLVYLQGKNVLEIMVEQVQKINSVNQILLEKKLKFIRNSFEHSELDENILGNLIKMNRQIESSVPNLLIRELARDSLSQGLKRMCLKCSEELLEYALQDLRNEILQQIANRNNETVKLIEYPYSIVYFILQNRKPTQFIIKYYIPLLIQLVKFDHPVILNLLNQAMLFMLQLSMDGLLGQDILETRTLLGQIVLKGLINHVNRLQNLTITEMALPCEIDSHIFIKFLFEIFGSKEKIKFIFSKSDMNPFLKPIFFDIVSKIFELSTVAKRLQCEDGRNLQKQLYELQVQLFKVGLTKKSQQNINKFENFLENFMNDPRGSIKGMPPQQVVNFLKYCSKIPETLMIEILGCHKELYQQIMENYVNSFNYSNLSLVDALRYLTSNFLLFGESQMIERILNSFTIRYYEQNQETVFKHPDFLFTYTYAIILLNTDLYNKTVTKHMSLDDFKKNTAKINDGESLPIEMIAQDYQSIQQDEIKCIRDFAYTDDLSQFVWEKYILNKSEMFESYNQLQDQFEIKTDDEHYGDLILTLMVHNIEELIIQTQDVQELTRFLQEVLNVCINNDKLDNAQQILVSVSKMRNEKADMSLYAGFFIAEQLLPYTTTQFQAYVNLIVDSIMQRHEMATDNISKECRSILTKIKTNNDFLKKKMGSNEGVLKLLTQYMTQSTQEIDDNLLNEIQITYQQEQLVGAKSPLLLSNLIKQTKLLANEDLNDFLQLLLDQINKIVDFTKEYVKFAQIIYIAIEILRVNTDRLLQFWPKVITILTQQQRFDDIKQNQIKQLLSSYCGYTLLKLVIEFIHQSQNLENYEECFLLGIKYLKDQSLEIFQEFLFEIERFLTSNSETNFSMQFLNHTVQLLLTIFNELEKKQLDENDANIIMLHVQNIFEQIQRFQSENDLVQILRKHLEVLNTLLKQQELRKVPSVDAFIAKHTLQIMNTYEKYIHQQDNSFLNELLTLAFNLSNDHLSKIIQIMMQAILNYNYKDLNQQDFIKIFNQVTSRQQQILQSNNDQMIVNYSQYLQRMYFNWIQKDNFSKSFWLDFLKKFGEIIVSLNKSPVQENVNLSFQCVNQNQHFQEILKSQTVDVIEKTKQIAKQYGLLI